MGFPLNLAYFGKDPQMRSMVKVHPRLKTLRRSNQSALRLEILEDRFLANNLLALSGSLLPDTTLDTQVSALSDALDCLAIGEVRQNQMPNSQGETASLNETPSIVIQASAASI